MLRSGMATNLLSHAAEISGRPALERPGLGTAEPGDPEERRARARGRAGAGEPPTAGQQAGRGRDRGGRAQPGPRRPSSRRRRPPPGPPRRRPRGRYDRRTSPRASCGANRGLGFGKLTSRPILSAAASARGGSRARPSPRCGGRRPASSSITAITSRAMPQRRTAFRSAGVDFSSTGAAARAARPAASS